MPVTVPIIDQLIHPSIGLLWRVAVPGNPLAGPLITLVPPRGPTYNTYGVQFVINQVGTNHSYQLGAPQLYDPPLAIASLRYQTADGETMIRQITRVLHTQQDLYWDEPLPGLLAVYMQPDVLLDLYWLQSI